jgi:PleD family two-component response regulator
LGTALRVTAFSKRTTWWREVDSEKRMATKTLLVVDDEPLLRTYVRDLLEGAGYAVKEAADAHEAIRFLEDDGITAVLTDIEMPGALDGIDLAWDLHPLAEPAGGHYIRKATTQARRPAGQHTSPH